MTERALRVKLRLAYNLKIVSILIQILIGKVPKKVLGEGNER